jgi:hypothetical protein
MSGLWNLRKLLKNIFFEGPYKGQIIKEIKTCIPVYESWALSSKCI